MTDLSAVLPDFPTQSYARLIPSLEKNLITTTDLITLDVVEIAKRAQLPLLDLKRLCDAVLDALHVNLDVGAIANGKQHVTKHGSLRKTGSKLVQTWKTIGTLDQTIDAALGGGIPAGYITEITGERQLAAPHGLSRSALYISTESALPTTRLSQMLSSHPHLASADPQPSLDQVISIVTPDLESQDHILRYQVPVAIQRHKIGLVVLDSVAANYRAEFERPGANRNGANMAKRSTELVKLGAFLRNLARTADVAIVVTNQVGDRFTSTPLHHSNGNPMLHRATQNSPLAYRSNAPPPPHSSGSSHPPSSLSAAADIGLMSPQTPGAEDETPMTLDHQQRWFTGWGDDHDHFSSASFRTLAQKTPSLGLVWTNQIACRVALIKTPVYGLGMETEAEKEAGEAALRRWRRYLKVVFAPWARPSGSRLQGAVQFEIGRSGIRACDVGKSGETAAGEGGGTTEEDTTGSS
ncbi:MAG: hypothetical protein M1818_003951 [Claussenomyces sp. TS43310]|nr:MAG: hypothetical protein M1818_003951 [Claussenomyces sp. TS43310]